MASRGENQSLRGCFHSLGVITSRRQGASGVQLRTMLKGKDGKHPKARGIVKRRAEIGLY